jgi:sugar/nucleoside kinase (ribokinase family)
VFVDLADPEKRLPEDLLGALEVLKGINAVVPVVLGLNLSEATQVNRVLGFPKIGNPEGAIVQMAQQIREKLGLYTVVVHPRNGAAGATREGTASFVGPFVQQPKISTGAGDHFNAGFAMGEVMGMGLEESLAMGCAVSGYYVRNAVSPTAGQLVRFLSDLPLPQG